ncbi:hypothetical protein [Klebsiella pneumoniae]|uniref:hypothetical protein n=1 Tax=Klebsiella pneumoniae TaxID=573 RepID=UPI0010D8CEAD|nr:hypothetical protein [Klebsiella pneumoniae]VGG24628.1 Uncharacterised protein [Klebsiella pneumoniae]
MKNEVEQIAQQNDMSIEFVTWFFNEKKANCGNVWFMMMAAMWEGWKGRSIEMDKLAAENVQIKAMNDCLSEELRGYESDGTFEGPKMHLLWWQVETPATDRIVAGIKADGVEEFVSNTVHKIFDESGALSALAYLSLANSHVKQLREGADK